MPSHSSHASSAVTVVGLQFAGITSIMRKPCTMGAAIAFVRQRFRLGEGLRVRLFAPAPVGEQLAEIRENVAWRALPHCTTVHVHVERVDSLCHDFSTKLSTDTLYQAGSMVGKAGLVGGLAIPQSRHLTPAGEKSYAALLGAAQWARLITRSRRSLHTRTSRHQKAYVRRGLSAGLALAALRAQGKAMPASSPAAGVASIVKPIPGNKLFMEVISSGRITVNVIACMSLSMSRSESQLLIHLVVNGRCYQYSVRPGCPVARLIRAIETNQHIPTGTFRLVYLGNRVAHGTVASNRVGSQMTKIS